MSIEVTNHGERILESENPVMVWQHQQRYVWAATLMKSTGVSPISIVDCACGTGYGAAMLADFPFSKVTGVDISADAVNYAKKTYSKNNLKFVQAGFENLALPKKSVDYFISFETIEHLQNPDLLVKKALEVLKPGGWLLVSTPNRIFSNLKKGEKPSNPFHFFEWSFLEFKEFLSRHFRTTPSFFVQNVKSQSKLHPLYMRSKLKRLTKRVDISSLNGVSSDTLEMLETRALYPMIYLAACQKT